MDLDLDGEIIDLDADGSGVELQPMPPAIPLASMLRAWPVLVPRKLVCSREWAPADEVVPAAESAPDLADTEPAPPPDPREDFLEAVRRLGRALGRVEVLGTWHRDRDEHGAPYRTIAEWAVGHLGVAPLVASLFPASCRAERDPFPLPMSPPRSTSETRQGNGDAT
jgi:hypothetical protein